MRVQTCFTFFWTFRPSEHHAGTVETLPQNMSDKIICANIKLSPSLPAPPLPSPPPIPPHLFHISTPQMEALLQRKRLQFSSDFHYITAFFFFSPHLVKIPAVKYIRSVLKINKQYFLSDSLETLSMPANSKYNYPITPKTSGMLDSYRFLCNCFNCCFWIS